MVQLEFQLHEEPEMGFYDIQMKRNGKTEQARFEVKEYGMYLRIGHSSRCMHSLYSCNFYIFHFTKRVV